MRYLKPLSQDSSWETIPSIEGELVVCSVALLGRLGRVVLYTLFAQGPASAYHYYSL